MPRELSIVTSSPITSLSDLLSLPATLSISLILVSPSVTWIVRAITFLTRTEKIWLEQPDTPLLQLIRVKNSPDAMTWNASDTYFFTCSKALSHGKDFPVDPKTRSTLPSRKRRSRPPSKISAVASLLNSKNLWSTVDHLNSSRSLTRRLV